MKILKIKNSKLRKIIKFQILKNSITQNFEKFKIWKYKNSKFWKIKEFNIFKNSKIQNFEKFKILNNSNIHTSEKLKNSKF